MLYLDGEMRSCLVAIAVLLAGASLAAAQLSNEECLACHDTVDAKKFAASIHGALQCRNFHPNITAPAPPEPAPKAVDCSQCHADAASEYAKSVHARGVAN